MTNHLRQGPMVQIAAGRCPCGRGIARGRRRARSTCLSRMSRVPWNFGGGHEPQAALTLLICRIGSDSLARRHAVEGGPQSGQVQVAVDAAELLAGFDHAGGAPAQRHLPVPPAFDVAGVVTADRDHRLDALVLRSVRANVGGTSRRSTVRVSARPSRRLAAAPGWVLSSSLASASSCASASSAEPAW